MEEGEAEVKGRRAPDWGAERIRGGAFLGVGGAPVLQVVQVQSVVEGHEIRVAGDPPEGHVVLRRESNRRVSVPLSRHESGGRNGCCAFYPPFVFV